MNDRFVIYYFFTRWNYEVRQIRNFATRAGSNFELKFITHIGMLLNITCNALDGANMPGKKEAVSASAAKNAQNHMENNRYIQSELVLKQLFTYD